MKNVIAVFDIGKTNKKILLFDESLKLVYQHEERMPTIIDEDGVECDNIDRMEAWILDTMKGLSKSSEYNVLGVNFSTYGATLMYLDENGKRLTPAYNYLKPLPKGAIDPLYEKWGGIEEFSRCTASPAFVDNMLNSGLQAYWLKKFRPEVFAKVKHVLHFPQYLSYLLTGKVASEYTSIGCHTAMWDFDNKQYHPWLAGEKIPVPQPISNSTVYDVVFSGKNIKAGIGIHDSSASLAPYILGSNEPFLLISTGTWCINMNPFNEEPLTDEQLKRDTLCYMSVSMKPVKSSRLFLGHILDVNAARIAAHFGLPADEYKRISANGEWVKKMLKEEPVYFRNGVPDGYVDDQVDLNQFGSYLEAYHRFVIDVTLLLEQSIGLVLPANDTTKAIYISGGFARNPIFVPLMAMLHPNKKVYTSEIDNSTALGAAIVMWEQLGLKGQPPLDLGLKSWSGF